MFFRRRMASPVRDFEAAIPASRVRLRRLRQGDLRDVLRLVNDWDVAKQTAFLPYPYPQETARRWLEADPARWNEDLEYALAIERVEGARFIGAIALYVRGRDRRGAGRAELGYWLGKPFWGHGLASEAVAAMMGFACGPLGITLLEALVFADNPASGRVLEKAGFRFERHEQRRYPERGGRRLVRRYAARAAAGAPRR